MGVPFLCSELRIDYGPGYLRYLVQRGSSIIVHLAGGDKDKQERDILAGSLQPIN